MEKLSLTIKSDSKTYRRNIVLPKSWDEVDYELFYKIAPKLLAAQSGDLIAIKTIASVLVENQIDDFFDYKRAIVEIDDELVYAIGEEIKPLLFSSFDKTPCKFFIHNGVRYFMPAARFGNFTMGEFHYVCQYFQAYSKKQDPSHLIKLLATVARSIRSREDSEKDWSFDKRRPLYVNEIATRAEAFKNVDAGILFAVYQYVQGSLIYLQKKHQIFSESDPDEKEKTLKEKLDEKLAELRASNGPVSKKDLEKIKRELTEKFTWRDIIFRLFREYGNEFEYWFNFPLYTGLHFLKGERRSIEDENERINQLNKTQVNDIK